MWHRLQRLEQRERAAGGGVGGVIGERVAARPQRDDVGELGRGERDGTLRLEHERIGAPLDLCADAACARGRASRRRSASR